MQNDLPSSRRAEQVMMAAIDQAIETAADAAGDDRRAAGSVKPAHDYFADVALHLMFMRRCEADQETGRGGNAKTAWEILYVGRRLARNWEKEAPSQRPEARYSRTEGDIEARENAELARSAERLAYTTAIRTLLESASANDLTMHDRLPAALEARLAQFGDESDVGRQFAELARRSMASLLVSVALRFSTSKRARL